MKLPDVDELMEKIDPTIIFGFFMFIVVAFLTAHFVYFGLFPLPEPVCEQCSEPQPTPTNITIDGTGLALIKPWTGFNQGRNEFTIDACNTAKRIGEDGVTWQITLKNC